ncbi:hypothetical protein [Janthinobacterium sp.]|uniref:hypothetical protein n=1 Tax=Janthinobacterium sp. TaxID=1871054 RepID=UPI00293D4B42|nr:hypothetical protein [Janthinobacterium sp.]
MQHARASHTALASVWLASTEQIGWRYQGRQWLQVYLPLMCIGAFIAVGLFSAVVSFRAGRRSGSRERMTRLSASTVGSAR